MPPKNKVVAIETFMTKKDEADFSLALISSFNGIKFIDNHPWSTPQPQLKDSISSCYAALNSMVTILNENIIDLDSYSKYLVKQSSSGSCYTGASIGKGLIKFLHSKEADYAKGGLSNGSIDASYFPETDPETDIFVKSVWKIFKKGAKKVYLIDPETGELNTKPETRFFAWPDAAKTYDGTDGRYLT
ncbi:TPA: hypothetical protein ACH0SE_004669, partial [Providencia rettgeri]